MGLDLFGVVGAHEPLRRLQKKTGIKAPLLLDLPQGLQFLALTDARLDALTEFKPGAYLENFVHLSETLEKILSAVSAYGAMAYLEVSYFGGVGMQAAALFSPGKKPWRKTGLLRAGISSSDGPVNSVLRGLNVRAAPGEDEFEALGLNKIANN